MSWDTSKEMDSVNRPHFYISSECENILKALAEYTGEQGLKEAHKDPVDCLRYAAIADIDHLEPSALTEGSRPKGGY